MKEELLEELKKQLLVSNDKDNDKMLYQLIVEVKSGQCESITEYGFIDRVISWSVKSPSLGFKVIKKTA